MKLVLATQNPKKLKEMNEILSHLGVEVVSEAELGVRIEVEETGETFTDNARLKATAVMQATGLPAVADDSGLEVDALGGAPGIYSARYTGNHEYTDTDRLNLVLKNLGSTEHRTARFVSCISCTFPNGDRIDTRGTCEGTIQYGPTGENGFGYDPIFRPDGYDCSMAELAPEQKNAISHRGHSLNKFYEELREYLNAHK